MTVRRLIATLAGTCLVAIAFAQEPAKRSDQEPTYLPLFADETIQRASPQQATRMRAAEARNHQAFDKRRQEARARKAAANAEMERKAAGSTRQDALPGPAAQGAKSKVYKWVDADGRVHFGDAPQGRNAREIKIGGAANIKGTPLLPRAGSPAGTQNTD